MKCGYEYVVMYFEKGLCCNGNVNRDVIVGGMLLQLSSVLLVGFSRLARVACCCSIRYNARRPHSSNVHGSMRSSGTRFIAEQKE